MNRKIKILLITLNSLMMGLLLYGVFEPLISIYTNPLFKEHPEIKDSFLAIAKGQMRFAFIIFGLYGLTIVIELVFWKVITQKNPSQKIINALTICSGVLFIARILSLLYLSYYLSNLIQY